MGRARAAYFGPGLELSPHRSAAATLALALERPFAIRFLDRANEDSPWQRSRATLIPSGMLHHLRAHGAMAFVYLDPLSDDHAQLAAADLAQAHRRVQALLRQEPRASVDDVCAALGVARRTLADARIAKVVRALEQSPEDFRTIEDAASRAGLSSSRFRALFRQHVGLPFRRYRLWRRMTRVGQRLRAGDSLTRAALASGFASSAHLSSAFVDMFGLSPSHLLKAGVELDVAQRRLDRGDRRV